AADWTVFRGNAGRNARTAGAAPQLAKVLWERPTVLELDDETGKPDGKNGGPHSAGVHLKRALDRQVNTVKCPVMGGHFPIAVNGKVVFRTYGRLSAIYLKDFKDPARNFTAKPGDTFWHSTDLDGALTTVLDDPTVRPTLQTWLNDFNSKGTSLSFLYENAVTGTLSTDGRLVYLIYDLAVPRPPALCQQRPRTRQHAPAVL